MSEINIRKLSIISNKKGDLLKGFLKSENKNIDVKEVYFSEINPNEIKAWKRHKSMTSNLIVVKGEVKVVIQEIKGKFISEVISKNNYKMITIPPNYWFGFQCIGDKISLLANISDEEHRDIESEELSLNNIEFDWS